MGKTVRQEERLQFASNPAGSSQNADASGDKRPFVATSTSIAYDSKQVRPQKIHFSYLACVENISTIDKSDLLANLLYFFTAHLPLRVDLAHCPFLSIPSFVFQVTNCWMSHKRATGLSIQVPSPTPTSFAHLLH